MKAPPLRTPSEWAKAERVMPSTSPEPGPVRPERNPYLIEVGEAFVNPKAKRITYVTGTQSGKSFLQENVMGERADDDPGPIIYYAPTESNITKKVEPLVMAMISQSKSLSKKFDKDSTQFVKRIGAARLYLSFMGSTTETASTSARLILVDELDRASKNAEGSVVELAEARGEAYADSRIGFTATPTIGRVKKYTHPETGFEHWEVADKATLGSPIWEQWQQGSRHEWAVPCPDCSSYFIPHSGLLWWPGKGSDDECDPSTAEREARLVCSCCGTQIADKHRGGMNALGRYVAPGQSIDKSGVISGVAETEGNSHFSYHSSGMFSFSAKKSFGYLAKKLLSALNGGDPSVLQPVYNTGFGECYAVAGEAPPWESVRAQSWKYGTGTVVGNPEYLLATVDVQKNRLVWLVRAWYLGMGSALVDCGVLWGDTLQDAVWEELDELLDQSFDGHDITEMGIDYGYRPDQVSSFIRTHRSRTRALRGEVLDKAFRKVDVEADSRGKVRRYGEARWDFDSPRAKSWVHSRIGRSNKKPAFWLLPADIDESYCKEIVGEEYDESSSKWKKVGENHFLDCEAMQYMLAQMRGLKRKRGAVLLSELADGSIKQVEEAVSEKTKKPKKKRKQQSHQSDDWFGGDGWL